MKKMHLATATLLSIPGLFLWLSVSATAFGPFSPCLTSGNVFNVKAAANSPLFSSQSKDQPKDQDDNFQDSQINGSNENENENDSDDNDNVDIDINIHALGNKTEDEVKFLEQSLLQNVMFASLPQPSLERLINAFELFIANKQETIMKQGESCEGDYVYLVAQGKCTVFVDGKVVPEPYGTLKSGSIFGELGVLYNRTRSATIVARTNQVKLYRIKGDTFKSILNEQSIMDDPETLADIDNVINQVSGTKSLYGGDIIRPYKPNRSWLWARWKGTVFQHTFKTVGIHMLLSLAFTIWVRWHTDPTWTIGLTPDKEHPLIQRLEIIRRLWSLMMSLTTFILTFYVNQAYSFWQEVLSLARKIQGRLNDIHALLATGAKRNSDGTYSKESDQLLDEMSQYSRLFHALFWASCARRFSILRTKKGLERLASRGLMTYKELQVLQSLELPDNQRHNACAEWMMVRAWQGIEAGILPTQVSFSDRFMDLFCQLRVSYASITDKLSARMPLPYTHLVQVLVDVFVTLSPIALYPELGAYSMFGVGVLSLFYTGLLDLAKVFLDPLDNEDFTKNAINMDLGVLIRESNAGSTRWKNAGARLPFENKFKKA